MRMEKIKSAGSLARALDHNTREKIPANADTEKTPLNKVIGEGMAKYERLKPAKIRSNAVHAVEVLLTASPEFTPSEGIWQKYLIDCGRWANAQFGEENLLTAAIHWDEKTPHIHLVFMPLKDGKLNARHYIGGGRDRMAELQGDFWDKVGKKYGLDRGRPREETRSQHTHHRLYDLSARENAVNVAAQDLNQGQRLVAAVIKGVQDFGGATKDEMQRLWPQVESRLQENVVKDIIKNDRALQAAKKRPEIGQNLDPRQTTRTR